MVTEDGLILGHGNTVKYTDHAKCILESYMNLLTNVTSVNLTTFFKAHGEQPVKKIEMPYIWSFFLSFVWPY